MSDRARKHVVRDRDIILDTDGRIFVTLGYIQPPTRVLSFLKYIPDPSGKWAAGGQRYRRLFWGSVDSVVNGLRAVPSEYLVDDPHFGTELLEVPNSNIQHYFLPEERLHEIRTEGASDRLEESTLGLADALHDALGIPYTDIGVAGSILWKGHNPEFSDINMNVYGFKSSWSLREGFSAVDSAQKVRLRESGEWVSGISRIRERVPLLSDDDVKTLFERRIAFYYDNQCIGVTPILRPNEVPIHYSSESYQQVSSLPITISFEVEYARYGLFSPSTIYGKSGPIDSIDGEIVSRLMIYEGVYSGLIEEGDTLEVAGTLQKVVPKDGDPFYQLMIGTKSGAGKEYIRLG